MRSAAEYCLSAALGDSMVAAVLELIGVSRELREVRLMNFDAGGESHFVKSMTYMSRERCAAP